VGDPTSYSEILWSSDPATRRVLWTCFGLVAALALVVFVPLLLRTLRLFFLERRLRDTLDEYESKGAAAQRSVLREWLRDSVVQRQFEEFERRWTTAQIAEGGGRAPIRLLDVLEDQPLLPVGPRRSLLAVLPGVLLGIWVLGALFGLIPSATGLPAPVEGAPALDPLALQLGLALRALAWGFASLIVVSVGVSLVEGSFEARSRGLDDVLVRAYEAVSPGELAEITRQTQQKSLDILGRELTQFAHELNERMERGLQRIEQSSARAASLVSQEQRGALHSVVQELSLSVRQGVDHHLAELRNALQRAVDYQSSVTNGLSETYERMVENAQMQDRVARTLTDSANALDAAARSIRSGGGSGESAGAPATLRPLGDGFEAERLRESEAVAAQIAEELGDALRGFTQQVQQIDKTMEALRLEIQEDGLARKDGAGDAAARRGKPGTPATRERAWAPAPDARPLADRPAFPTSTAPAAPAPPPAMLAPASTSSLGAAATSAPRGATPTATPVPAAGPPPVAATGERTGDRVPAPERASERTSDRGADLASVDGPIGRELSLSGFRVGAPRAQGPDPYERLASAQEPPSNVRHFPTRDRELGDELKLSGLLGPSTPPVGGPAPAAPRHEPAPAEPPRDDEHPRTPEDPE
jgi:hypothetical protein